MLVGEEKHCDTGSAAKNGYSLLPHVIVIQLASEIILAICEQVGSLHVERALWNFRSIHQFAVQIEANTAFAHGTFCLAAEVPSDHAGRQQDEGR